MAKTTTFHIHVAGNFDDAIRATKQWCSERGDCYSLSRCTYVYSGGVEDGVRATRINYARYPEDTDMLCARVHDFAHHLAVSLFQKSYSVEGPKETTYHKLKGYMDDD